VKKEPRWISKAAALAIHQALLAAHGGPIGTRDEALLESALAGPKNRPAYGEPDIFQLAAGYASALTRNHPFNDGNKRVALTVAGVFPELNGYRLEAPEVDAVRATIALSTREMEEAEFATWLRGSSKKMAPTKAPLSTSKRKRGTPGRARA